ncbi:MAG: hypothetical protein PUC88_00755 [Clostridia bacterium]|nr:hypothetical protein [Clostridia bacterium]
MQVLFSVHNQCISKIGSDPIVDDSINYVQAKFKFSGSIWDNVVKTAVFTYNGTSYTIVLSEFDDCYIPSEVLKGRGFTLGVMTSYLENGVTKMICTKPCFVKTVFSCYNEKIEETHNVVPQYDQLLAVIASLEERKVDVEEGKGLSDQNFTVIEKAKLNSIQHGAQENVIEHVCVNEVEVSSLNKIVNIEVPTKTSQLSNDANFATHDELDTSYYTYEDSTVNLDLNDNSEYLLSSDSLQTVNISSNAFSSRGCTAFVTLKSGDIPVSIIYPEGIKWSGDNISDNEFVPTVNKNYALAFWNDGININCVVRGIDA